MAVSKLATPYMFQNFGAKRWWDGRNQKVTTIVVHHAATTNFDAMPGVWATREASAHYGIGQDGTIRAYVDENNTAWHAGNGNSYSIGIECTNTTGAPDWKVSEKTIDALVALIQEIQSRYGKLNIVGHKDVPGCATACPGPFLYPRLPEIRNRVNGAAVATPSTPKPSKYNVKAWNVKQVVDVDNLEVREAQTTKAKAIRKLKKGSTFNATRMTDNGEKVGNYTSWFEVDGVGWVPGAHVTPVKATPAAPKYKVEAWNVRQRVDVNGLRIRAAQNTKAKQIGTLNAGQTFNATRICRNGEKINGYTTWFEVNGSGWVSGAYVTPI